MRETIRELRVVVRHELGQLVKSPRGILTALIFVGALFTVLFIAVNFSHQFTRRAAAQGKDARVIGSLLRSGEVIRVVAGAFAGNDGVLRDELQSRPPHSRLLFFLAMAMVPFVSAITGYDLMSSEIENKTIRFLLLRVRRESLLIGKLIAHVIGLFVAITLGWLVAHLYAFSAIPASNDLSYWPRCVLLATLVGAVYASLTMIGSVLASRSASARGYVMAGLVAIGILSTQAPLFTPSGWRSRLYYPLTSIDALLGIGMHLVFVVFFAGIALAILRRREL